MGIIYKIYNDINDKVYIGQTRQKLNDRWHAHKYNAEHKIYDYYLYRAMNKYGIDNFHIEIVEECPNEELNEKEIAYINKFNSYAPNGYNSTKGGDGNTKYDYNEVVKHYKECGENMSECNRKYGYSYDTISNALQSQGLKPHEFWEFSATPVYECDIDNNILMEFPNYKAVVEYYPELDMTIDGLGNYLARPRTNKYRNKYFCRKEDYEKYKLIDHHNKQHVRIKCLETGLEFLSITDAARWVKENCPEIKGTVTTVTCNISKAIKMNWHSYGYTWEKY